MIGKDMKGSTIIHRSATREAVSFPFMKAFHSFRPHLQNDRKHFGTLVAIDDATVLPASKGFGFHSHNNLEVITFLIEGEVNHEDKNVPAHNGTLIGPACQLITSGTGIVHNERNNSETEQFRGLQIWILPRANELTPKYSKKRLSANDHTNQLELIISPDGENNSLTIQQDAYIYYGVFNRPEHLQYENKRHGNITYCYVYRGELETQGTTLRQGDAVGLTNAELLKAHVKTGAEILLFDIPKNN
jgi:redox-sensitive bicupin YhaK (pirin superfamily)